MLGVAVDREVKGDVCHNDMGQGFGFRPGSFDAAVSISAIQWLCHAEKKAHNPIKRLNTFFNNLYACLIKGARVVLQFYPEGPEQIDMITHAALKNGFQGGLLVDYPNSRKARKHYLFLMAGYSEEIQKEAREVIANQAKEDAPDEENKSVKVFGDFKDK